MKEALRKIAKEIGFPSLNVQEHEGRVYIEYRDQDWFFDWSVEEDDEYEDPDDGRPIGEVWTHMKKEIQQLNEELKNVNLKVSLDYDEKFWVTLEIKTLS